MKAKTTVDSIRKIKQSEDSQRNALQAGRMKIGAERMDETCFDEYEKVNVEENTIITTAYVDPQGMNMYASLHIEGVPTGQLEIVYRRCFVLLHHTVRNV